MVEGVRICMIEDSEGGTTEASSRVGEGVVIVPEEWQLHPLPQSPPTHLVPLPDMEIDLPDQLAVGQGGEPTCSNRYPPRSI